MLSSRLSMSRHFPGNGSLCIPVRPALGTNPKTVYTTNRNKILYRWKVIALTIAIIVEGKNDKKRIKRIVTDDILILCTFGTPGTLTLEQLKKQAENRHVFLFTDNDASGKRIRGILRDLFPDSEQIYTRRGYAGVEGTPEEYLIQQLEKAGLEEYIIYPPPSPALD
jgi:toprim domain protein